MLVPTGNSLPFGRPEFCSNVALPILQSEIAFGLFQLTMVPELPTNEDVVILLGQLKFKTASCPFTVTVKVQVAVLLQRSAALYSTIEIPIGKELLFARPPVCIAVAFEFGQVESRFG